MKAQVIVTPLPIGSKMRVTKEQNYQQLLLANNNNVVETQWWDHFLVPLEEKYQLLYRSGKSVFQIYYLQGKNLVANKEINQTVSKMVERTNKQWQEIVKVTRSFEAYRVKRLQPGYLALKTKMDELVAKQRQTDRQSEEYKEIVAAEEQLLNEYRQSELVKEVEQEYQAYQQRVSAQINHYLASNTKFEDFLKTVEVFVPRNQEPTTKEVE